MEVVRLFIAALVTAVFCVSAQAQSHYQLKYSDLLQNCSFIHRDEFSLDSFQELIKAQLETRIEGDNVCQSAFRALNTNLESMLTLIDQNVSSQDARKLYGEMYGEYLVSLQTELTMLNPGDPRAAVLQSQIDALKDELLKNDFEIRLYDRTSTTTQLQQGQQKLFGQISSLVQNLAQMPTSCASKIGGWQQVLPAILNATSFVGMATGQLYLPAASASLQVGTEIAMILRNQGVKRAMTKLVAQKNNQIIACTYQAITHQACELKRATESVADNTAVLDIINNRYTPGSEGEYEKFERVQRLMPKVRDIIRKVGDMGSAVTLDLELLAQYFQALRVRPFEINPPGAPDGSPESEARVNRWLTDVGARGIDISTRDSFGNIRTIAQRYERAVEQVNEFRATINNVVSIIREKRSFKDLRDELILTSRNLGNELGFINEYLRSFPIEKTELPPQYRALFEATTRILDRVRDFVDVAQRDGENYEDYLKRVEALGDEMFKEFSYGSVAQLTGQTVLLIPAIAIERFERPLRAIENFYLNQDITERENPTHNSYATYTIDRAVRVRILNMYKNLSGSGQAFRLEDFETTKLSFERGFRTEIRKMIEQSLTQDSPILGGVLKGKTAAHMCALFADHLKRENPRLLARCEAAHGKLPLYQIMSGYRRPVEMTIDYNDPCFYADYRREEYAQSLLFDRLLDYGFNKKRR